LLTLSII